jgi:hypothetical protein
VAGERSGHGSHLLQSPRACRGGSLHPARRSTCRPRGDRGHRAETMSVLGQKRISRRVCLMSVLPLKADIRQCEWHVRYVPEAEVAVSRDLGTRVMAGPSRLFSLNISGQLEVTLKSEDR